MPSVTTSPPPAVPNPYDYADPRNFSNPASPLSPSSPLNPANPNGVYAPAAGGSSFPISYSTGGLVLGGLSGLTAGLVAGSILTSSPLGLAGAAFAGAALIGAAGWGIGRALE